MTEVIIQIENIAPRKCGHEAVKAHKIMNSLIKLPCKICKTYIPKSNMEWRIEPTRNRNRNRICYINMNTHAAQYKKIKMLLHSYYIACIMTHKMEIKY